MKTAKDFPEDNPVQAMADVTANRLSKPVTEAIALKVERH